ncbi:hypothetical protein DB41_IV00020 [Neochlamydia sp. TUME1]|uniref:hypothetical protein n=1 Tax=Neochlamydia sp. TUME1 TaxID=1478174 RepID=UPI00057D24C4|nr:hypothetical protein [Neochlamydia sp. TUME1]KIC74016.1 hypothetical protein DB41_IV00020 [Neochlamydia sp. TUME1]
MIINGLGFTLGPIHEGIKELILSLNPNMRHVLLVLDLLGRNLMTREINLRNAGYYIDSGSLIDFYSSKLSQA